MAQQSMALKPPKGLLDAVERRVLAHGGFNPGSIVVGTNERIGLFRLPAKRQA